MLASRRLNSKFSLVLPSLVSIKNSVVRGHEDNRYHLGGGPLRSKHIFNLCTQLGECKSFASTEQFRDASLVFNNHNSLLLYGKFLPVTTAIRSLVKMSIMVHFSVQSEQARHALVCGYSSFYCYHSSRKCSAFLVSKRHFLAK